MTLDALNTSYALFGVGAGLVASPLLLLSRVRPLAFVVGVPVACSAALIARGAADARLVLCVLGLGAVALGAPRRGAALAVIVAAVLVGSVPTSVPLPLRCWLIVVAVLTSWGAQRVGSVAPRWLAAAGILGVATGVWLAVPDTEAAVLVLGTTLVACAACAPHADVPLPPLPTAAWAAVMMPILWAGAWGAPGRPSALWGALATAGPLLVLGLVRLPLRLPLARSTVLVLALGQMTAVVAGARWAARTSSMGVGMLRSAVILAASAGTVLAAYEAQHRMLGDDE